MKLKALWYCTKNKPYLQVNRCVLSTEYDRYILDKKQHYSAFGEPLEKLNGKIVAKSDYDVEEIDTVALSEQVYENYSNFNIERISKESRLTCKQMVEYLGDTWDSEGYAIHIENLYKFIKPKELKGLYVKGTYHNAEQMFTDEIQINGEWFHPMKKAPQNMCYAFDKDGNKYVVISVRPEWLCLILNGLKDVELRRKVLKEMKK